MNEDELINYIIRDLYNEKNNNDEIQDLKERNGNLENQLLEYEGQPYDSYFEPEYDPKTNGSIWSLIIFGCVLIFYTIYRVLLKDKDYGTISFFRRK